MGTILVVLFGLINFVRGRGYISKAYTSFLAGIVYALFSFNEYGIIDRAAIDGLIVFLGVWLWAAYGHGKYFMSFHGEDKMREKEVPWIGWLTDKLYTPKDTPASRRKWGTIAMSLRGLHIFPMFLALGIYHNTFLFTGVAFLLQGVIYASTRYIKNEDNRVMIAEIIIGLLMGSLLLVS